MTDDRLPRLYRLRQLVQRPSFDPAAADDIDRSLRAALAELERVYPDRYDQALAEMIAQLDPMQAVDPMQR